MIDMTRIDDAIEAQGDRIEAAIAGLDRSGTP